MSVRLAGTHNLLVNRPPKEVRANVEAILKRGSIVVAFQEASTYLGIIRDVAAVYGYRVIVHQGSGLGMKSSVLLVKMDSTIVETGVAKVWASWIGPRVGIKWPGRSIPWAIVEVAGEKILFACVHAPTGRNGNYLNRQAFRLFMRKLRRLYRRKLKVYKNLKFFFLGDWNCTAGDSGARSVKKLLVERLNALVANPHCSPPIDYAVHNLLKKVTANKGPDYNSDHDSADFVLAA